MENEAQRPDSKLEVSSDAGRSSHGNARAQGEERLANESGRVLIIDQFMLANDQFYQTRDSLVEGGESPASALSEAAIRYGGCVVKLAPGEYSVFRDPQQTVIALAPAGAAASGRVAEEEGEEEDSYGERVLKTVVEARGNAQSLHSVFVDTRCVVFLDASRIEDQTLVDAYREIRRAGDEKRARDFLREAGGAVRYGFNRYGDELGVFKMYGRLTADENDETLALWPDIVD